MIDFDDLDDEYDFDYFDDLDDLEPLQAQPGFFHFFLEASSRGLRGSGENCESQMSSPAEKPSNGGFHGYGGTPKWMVYKGNSH